MNAHLEIIEALDLLLHSTLGDERNSLDDMQDYTLHCAGRSLNLGSVLFAVTGQNYVEFHLKSGEQLTLNHTPDNTLAWAKNTNSPTT